VVSSFEKFPKAQERLGMTLKGDFFQQPAYRFWFLYRERTPVLCFETTGTVWTEKGMSFHLMDVYHKKRRMWPVVFEIAGHLLP
jgi:hypothetical protein